MSKSRKKEKVRTFTVAIPVPPDILTVPSEMERYIVLKVSSDLLAIEATKLWNKMIASDRRER